MILSYKGLKIEIPYDSIQIEDIDIMQALDEHIYLNVKFLIEEGKLPEYINKNVEEETITASMYNKDLKRDVNLFAGKIDKVHISYENGLHIMELKCVSFTKDFDIKKNSRTFCNLDMTYNRVISKILESYNNKDFKDYATGGKTIGDFLLQYEETDWQFIKRLATHFNTSVLANAEASSGRFSFGLPKLNYNKEINIDDYEVIQDVHTYNMHRGRNLGDISVDNYKTWNIVTDKVLILGEEVKFNGVKCQVIRVNIGVHKEELKIIYTLALLKGIKNIYKTNPKIFGMSIPAIAKEVNGNMLRVHFGIDPVYESCSNGKYFTYAIESSSWYCMPEVGSKVHIYFPTNYEYQAIAVNAIRTSSASTKTSNPDNKSFSNTSGSEMSLTPSDMTFAADDGKSVFLTLSQSGDVSLVGKNINFTATEDLELGMRNGQGEVPPLRPNNVKLSSKNKIEISKGGSLSIKIEDETSIHGPTIKYIGTVKDPVGPLPEIIEKISENDQEIKDAINNGAKEFQMAKVQEGKSKFGFGVVATVIGAVAMAAATVATGGVALVVAGGIGLASGAVGVANMIEGSNDYSKAQSGDFSRSNNFVRDFICGGNETLYNIVKYGSVMAAGIATAVVTAGSATVALKSLGKLGLDAGMDGIFNLLADYADDGKINNGFGHYLKSASLTFGLGGTATGMSNRFEVLAKGNKLDCDQLRRIRTGTDIGFDLAGQLATDGEVNITTTVARKYISNKIFFSDPVDGVTGSFYIPATDIVIPDIHEEFKIERKYESTNKRIGSLGKGWTVNIETFVELDEDKAHILCYDGHVETFNNVDGKWINDKGGACIYTLEFIENHWIFKSHLEKKIYKYNENGRLINIIDRFHNKLSITYIGDSIDTITTFSNYKLYFTYKDNKIIQIKDDIGRTVQYRYAGDNLTEVVHVDYGITAYTYNEEEYINSITDQNGNTYTKSFFDSKGRVIAQEYPNGDICDISYDDENRENSFYYHQSKRTEKIRYNKDGLITHVFYEDGSTEEYLYDKYENKIYEKDRNGFETHRKYDEFGNLLEEISANDLKEEYTYDKNQNLLTKVDNTGREIIYTYNKNGTLKAEKAKVSVGEYISESYTYDSYGRILTKIDGNENITTYEYEIGEHIGKDPTRVITNSKYEYNYEYDEVGRNTSITTDYGTVEFGYNRLNYITLIKDGNGNVTRKFYDKMGNLIRFVPPNNYEKSFDNGDGYEYKYDHLDRLISVKNPLGYVNKSIRDSEGNIIKEINPNFYNPNTKDGIGVEYSYDKDNRKIKTIYPDGGIERVFYDSNGNIIKHISPEYYDEEKDDGLGYSYIYDNMNRLSSIINEEGITEKTFKYDFHGNLIKEIDEEGNETLFKYDLLGNLIEKRVPAEKLDLLGENHDKVYKIKYNVTCYSYDKNSNKILERHGTTLVDEKEVCNSYHDIYFSYDKENRLVEVKDKYGAKARYKYDCLNNKIYESFKINDTTEKIIHYIYDKAGNLIEKKEEIDGKFISKDNEGKTVWAITKYKYDKNGNITNIITPKGFEIERAYDKIDRVVKQFEKDTKNNILRGYAYSYDKIDNVISLKEYSGHKDLENIEPKPEKNYRYDSKNRLTHYINASGNTTRLFYDKNDRIIKEVLPKQYNVETDDGLGNTYYYDLRGKVIEVKNPLGEVIAQNTYDIKGNIKTSIDGEKNKVEYTYNLLGQIKEVITPNSKKENKVAQSYKYDGRGNITGIIDGNGNETRYLLDDWGRITKIITPEGGEETYTYDYAGNITSTTDSNGGTIEYFYNSLGQVSEIKDQEGYSEYFYYDNEGNVTKTIDRNDNHVERSYNLDRNIVSVRAYNDGDKESVITEKFTYNEDGTLKSAYSGNMQYEYSYTKEGMLESKSACGRELLRYTYDRNNNIKSIKDITGKSSIYSYDEINRVKTIKDNNENTLAAYDYYKNSNIKSVTLGNGVKTDYIYDGDGNVNSLVTVTSKGEVLVDYNYAYDLNGNRLEKLSSNHKTYYTYDSMNRLKEANYDGRKEFFTYDKVGNRLSKVTNNIVEKYVYNVKNQLKELHYENGTTYFIHDKQGNTIKEETNDGNNIFEYNPLNQQTKAITKDGNTLVNRYDAEGLRYEIEENEKLTRFIFHKDNVLVETDNDFNVISRFARGYEIVAADIVDSELESNLNRYYYTQDEQGSTIFITDKDEGVRNHYHYDAFGNILDSKEEVHNRITYTGQQFDNITQQYYLRARFYNPVIGRFTQEDIYRGDGLNLYAYCANNPVVYYDPSGYESKSICPDKGNTFNEDVDNADILKGKEVYGPYYDEAKQWYKEDSAFFSDPDKSTIVQGEDLKKARDDYNTLVSQGSLEKGHHRQGLAFGGENINNNITYTGESTIKIDKLEGLDLDFYSENGYGKENAKILKMYKNEAGIYVFGNNPRHTAATKFQNKVLKWQRDNGLRK